MEMPEKNIEVLLHAGDSYAIPDNTPRSFEVMGSGEGCRCVHTAKGGLFVNSRIWG